MVCLFFKLLLSLGSAVSPLPQFFSCFGRDADEDAVLIDKLKLTLKGAKSRFCSNSMNKTCDYYTQTVDMLEKIPELLRKDTNGD